MTTLIENTQSRIWQNDYTQDIDSENFDIQKAFLAAMANWLVLGQENKQFAKKELQELEEAIRNTVQKWQNDLNSKAGMALRLATAGFQVSSGIVGFAPHTAFSGINGLNSGISALMGRQVEALNIAHLANDMGKFTQVVQGSLSGIAGGGQSVTGILDSHKQSKVTGDQSRHSCQTQWLQNKSTEVQEQSQQKEKAQRAISDTMQQSNQARLRLASPAA